MSLGCVGYWICFAVVLESPLFVTGFTLNSTCWSDLGEYSYRLVATNVTWLEARRQCAAIGAVMPVLRSYKDFVAMVDQMRSKALSTIAVGISKFSYGINVNKSSTFRFSDTGEVAPCWGWTPYNKSLADANYVALSVSEGYVNINEKLTNAVCQLFRSTGDLNTLPCAQLLLYSWRCNSNSTCHSTRVIPETMMKLEYSLGYVFTSHIPGITVPVTEMVLDASGNKSAISVRAMNSSQIDSLLALGFIHNSIIGYVAPSAGTLGCALSVRLCWNHPKVPTDSLFTLHNCAPGWTEMGVAYTLCSCANDCCTKLNESISVVDCSIISTSTRTTSTTSTTTTSTTRPSTTTLRTTTTDTTPMTTTLPATTPTTRTTSSTSTTTTSTSTTSTAKSTTRSISTSTSIATTVTTTVSTTTDPTTEISTTMTATTTTVPTTVPTSTAASTIPVASPTTTEKEPPVSPLPVDSRVETVVNVLSGFGSAILVGTLASIIILFILMRDFSVERLIHMNQELALMTAHIIIMTAKDRSSSSTTRCAAASIAVQYLFYVNFAFLLLDSIHVYMVLTSVVHNASSFPRLDCIVITWAMPAILTSACARAYFYEYPSKWTCWLNWNHPAITEITLCPITVAVWVTLIFAEAATMKQYPPLIFCDRAQRFAAEVNQKGVVTLVTLNFAAWFVESQAVHRVNVALYTIAFGLKLALAIATFFFHALGSPKVPKFVSELRTQVVAKVTVIITHYGHLQK